jgi:hypothetical protein
VTKELNTLLMTALYEQIDDHVSPQDLPRPAAVAY